MRRWVAEHLDRGELTLLAPHSQHGGKTPEIRLGTLLELEAVLAFGVLYCSAHGASCSCWVAESYTERCTLRVLYGVCPLRDLGNKINHTCYPVYHISFWGGVLLIWQKRDAISPQSAPPTTQSL